MLCFPQLSTGAVSQFPGWKRMLRRTVVNEAADGSRVKLGDAGASELEWILELKGLAESEWEAIEDLFETVEGRLGSFTFLDPFGNLLQWSEEQNAAVWQRTAGVSAVGGGEDPLGGLNAFLVTNAGPAAGRIWQSIAAPSWYSYCLSVWARSQDTDAVALFAGAPGSTAEREYAIGPKWKRLEHSVKLGSSAETVEFGAALAAGTALDLFGFQVEAQAGASKYRKTTGRGGVYAGASFVEDELVRTAEGVDNSRVTLRIRASA
jgi:hypothetical protein